VRREGQRKSELLREALRRYIEERKWARLYRYGETKASEKWVTEEQVEDIIDAHRK